MSDSQAKWLLILSGRLFGQNEKRDNFDVLKKVTRLKRKFISQVKKLTLALLLIMNVTYFMHYIKIIPNLIITISQSSNGICLLVESGWKGIVAVLIFSDRHLCRFFPLPVAVGNKSLDSSVVTAKFF